VAGAAAQVERLDGDPFDVVVVRGSPAVDDGAEPAHDRLEGGGPVLLGPEQQPDEVLVVGHRRSSNDGGPRASLP
jgi:hypothetical protein